MKVEVLTPISKGGPYIWGKHLVKELKKKNVDAIHVCTPLQLLWRVFHTNADLVHTTVPLSFRLWFKPVILTIKGDYRIEKFIWKLFYPLSIKYATTKTCSTKFLKKTLDINASIIPNGVDLDRFSLWKKHRPSNEVSIVTMTKFGFRDKGVSIYRIAECLNFLQDTKVRWTILGGGKYLNEVKKEVKEIVQNRFPVKFLGFVKYPERELPKHDIFAYYSYHDSFATAVIEAMACFPEETQIKSGEIKQGISRFYDGQMVEINTKHNKLVCTPNHPILTKKGWVKAKDLNITDGIYTLKNTNCGKYEMDKRRRKNFIGQQQDNDNISTKECFTKKNIHLNSQKSGANEHPLSKGGVEEGRIGDIVEQSQRKEHQRINAYFTWKNETFHSWKVKVDESGLFKKESFDLDRTRKGYIIEELQEKEGYPTERIITHQVNSVDKRKNEGGGIIQNSGRIIYPKENSFNTGRNSISCWNSRWRRNYYFKKRERTKMGSYNTNFKYQIKVDGMVNCKNNSNVQVWNIYEESCKEKSQSPVLFLHKRVKNITPLTNIASLFNPEERPLWNFDFFHKKKVGCKLWGKLLKLRNGMLNKNKEIKFERITGISQKRHKGKIYNLRTSNGIYFANNILVHNCGLPVVTNNYGPTHEIIKHKHDGFIENDAEDYLASLGELVENWRKRKNIGIAARRKVAQKFGWDAVSDQYLTLYRGLLNGKKRTKK